MNRRTVLWGALMITMLGVSLATASSYALRHAPPMPLTVYGRAPTFDLTNHRGVTLRSNDLRGQVWVADFIFTRCSGQCPTLTSAMKQLQETFGSQLALVSFTVDPTWDTSERLADYAQRAGAASHWQFVTGSQQAIHTLATRGFQLSAAPADTTADVPTHSQRLALVDRAGVIRGYYNGSKTAAMQALQQDVRRLLGEAQ